MKAQKLPCILLVAALFMLTAPSVAASARLEIATHKTEEQGLPNNSVTALAPEGESGVFIASGGGLHVFLDYYFLPLFQHIGATALVRSPQGDLWAATDSGLIYRIRESDGIWTATRYRFAGKQKINTIAAERDALFIGTDLGVYCFSEANRAFLRVTREGAVAALACLPDGTLIAAVKDRNRSKSGLAIIGGRFLSRTGWVEELAGITIASLFVDADHLLAGTQDGRVFLLDASGIREITLEQRPGTVRALLLAGDLLVIGSDNGIFTGPIDGPLSRLVDGDGTAIAGVTCLAAGPGSSVWVGTSKDGIYLVKIPR
jgi:ligand-binding sensor domain-containing protein